MLLRFETLEFRISNTGIVQSQIFNSATEPSMLMPSKRRGDAKHIPRLYAAVCTAPSDTAALIENAELAGAPDPGPP